MFLIAQTSASSTPEGLTSIRRMAKAGPRRLFAERKLRDAQPFRTRRLSVGVYAAAGAAAVSWRALGGGGRSSAIRGRSSRGFSAPCVGGRADERKE
jgi:hypothetical protein